MQHFMEVAVGGAAGEAEDEPARDEDLVEVVDVVVEVPRVRQPRLRGVHKRRWPRAKRWRGRLE